MENPTRPSSRQNDFVKKRYSLPHLPKPMMIPMQESRTSINLDLKYPTHTIPIKETVLVKSKKEEKGSKSEKMNFIDQIRISLSPTRHLHEPEIQESGEQSIYSKATESYKNRFVAVGQRVSHFKKLVRRRTSSMNFSPVSPK